jgi:hypothetical protein
MDNPYAPPTTEPLAAGATSGDALRDGLYTVSARKFWILTTATMGVYVLAWGYQHWTHLKRRDRTRIWPVPRAIFIVFFLHGLLRRCCEIGAANGRWTAPPPMHLATIAVVMLLISIVLDRLSNRGIGFPAVDIASFAMVWVIGWANWRIQSVANAIAGDPRGASNDRFTVANWVWMSLGAVLWIMAIIGVVMIARGQIQP